MKKMNKKGFTIVELVIVIAVIAILAGVLIPTFTYVVRKANQSAAMQALDGARKELLSEVDATEESLDTFDATYFYYYNVNKKGTDIEKLQGVYKYADGAFTYVTDADGLSAYKPVYDVSEKATAYNSEATYYDKNGEVVAITGADEEAKAADFATKKATQDLYTVRTAKSYKGVAIYVVIA